MKKNLFLSSLLALSLLFTACSSHEDALANKSADFWYQKIIANVAMSNLSGADDAYSSLYSEHAGSPYLPESMLLLSKAHAYRIGELTQDWGGLEYVDEDWYNMDVFLRYVYGEDITRDYLDEYLKRFGTAKEQEYVEYLKVKIAFMGYRHPFRNQKFLDETIASVKAFATKYPNSNYQALVAQMLLRLELGRETLKDEIALLYDRVDKPKAAEYYRQKDRLTGVDMSAVVLPERSWIRNIFE